MKLAAFPKCFMDQLVVERGMNDHPRIFQMLKESGFQGRVSIEDGLNGLEEIRASAEFLRPLMAG
jgi:sugar phosphate isomerase/epimerase